MGYEFFGEKIIFPCSRSQVLIMTSPLALFHVVLEKLEVCQNLISAELQEPLEQENLPG